MPKGIPLTDEEINRRRREIFRASFPKMVQKGFNETSMREIAEAAGVGKSTLYDYFRTKDDVLLFVIEEKLEEITEAVKEIIGRPVSAVDRLRQIMEMELEQTLENKNFYFQLSNEAQKLGLHSQKRIAARRYAYQDLIKGVVEQGIEEGSLRKVNPLLASRLLINSLSNVVYTSRPTGTPQEMLAEIMDVFFMGVLERKPGEADR